MTAAPPLNPQALSVADVAQLLSRVSRERITEAMIEADLKAGAPVNPDGTIHLVHYCAWLVREVGDVRQHP